MTPQPPYLTAIADDGSTSCHCPDMRYRGGSSSAANPDTGETRRACKHQAYALAGLLRWSITRRNPKP